MMCCREIVRRKAVLCLCAFLRKVPDMAVEIHSLVRRSLGDRDPGVVWAAVEVYQQLAIVSSCCSMIACFLSVISEAVCILRNSAILAKI